MKEESFKNLLLPRESSMYTYNAIKILGDHKKSLLDNAHSMKSIGNSCLF